MMVFPRDPLKNPATSTVQQPGFWAAMRIRRNLGTPKKLEVQDQT